MLLERCVEIGLRRNKGNARSQEDLIVADALIRFARCIDRDLRAEESRKPVKNVPTSVKFPLRISRRGVSVKVIPHQPTSVRRKQ